MISTTIYVVGLLLRLGAVVLTMQLLRRTFSWRMFLIFCGIAWAFILPISRYFLAANTDYVSEVQKPGVFFSASVIIFIGVYQLVKILKENLSFSEKENQTSDNVVRYQTSLLSLAKLRNLDLNKVLAEIVKTDARELGVARVGVWMYINDKTAIETLVRIENDEVFEDPIQLYASDYPGYFNALELDALISANDARTHDATREFTESYLKSNDIHSMLDVPIRLDGEVVGIICHESVDSTRTWTVDEQEFAHSIADLCALALASDRRRKVETQLSNSQRLLTSAQDAGQFGSFRWSVQTNHLIWSGQTMHQLGFKDGQPPSFDKFQVQMLPADAENYVRSLRKAAREGTGFRIRFQLKPEFGGQYYEARGVYHPGNQEESDCFEGTVQNINEQVLTEVENQRLEEQLIQSQKMESIGTLAGGIAHDFNNILTPILGYTDIALTDKNLSSTSRDSLQEILHSGLRAKDLVEQILIFGRRWEEKRRPLDLADTINRALKLVRPTLPSTIQIEVDIKPGYKPVEADATQMIQVLVNLCTNAWHAMEPKKGGRLTLGLKPGPNDDTTILSVGDTGVGIDPEAKARIFDPFYTTKAVGKGTGLGLSVVHGIISKLGGSIEIDSTPDESTTFNLILPNTEKPITVQNDSENPQPLTPNAKSASILVVEDDEAIAHLLASMLSDLGHQADVHLNSIEALLCVQTGKKDYDLVITDMSMPNLSGIELTKKIRAQDPEIPILITSGYAPDDVRKELGDIPHCGIVGKPITKSDLALILEKELR